MKLIWRKIGTESPKIPKKPIKYINAPRGTKGIKMAKARGLGKSIFDTFDDNLVESKKGAGEMLRLSSIEPRHDQPRKTFDRESLEQLAESIQKYGVLQPIIVRPNQIIEDTYEIIAGERRWRAAKLAGLDEIPAVVLDGDDLKIAQVSIIENIQREDLNAVEEALAYQGLMDRFGLTQDQVAKQVGKSRPAVANLLRLLDLPEEVLEMLKNDEISSGHARALLGLRFEADAIALAHKTVEKELSVREVENAVKKLNAVPEIDEIDDGESVDMAVMTRIHLRELEKRSREVLGRKVRITNTPKKKVVEFTFDSDEDLETLLGSICGAEIFKDI